MAWSWDDSSSSELAGWRRADLSVCVYCVSWRYCIDLSYQQSFEGPWCDVWEIRRRNPSVVLWRNCVWPLFGSQFIEKCAGSMVSVTGNQWCDVFSIVSFCVALLYLCSSQWLWLCGGNPVWSDQPQWPRDGCSTESTASSAHDKSRRRWPLTYCPEKLWR